MISKYTVHTHLDLIKISAKVRDSAREEKEKISEQQQKKSSDRELYIRILYKMFNK